MWGIIGNPSSALYKECCQYAATYKVPLVPVRVQPYADGEYGLEDAQNKEGILIIPGEDFSHTALLAILAGMDVPKVILPYLPYSRHRSFWQRLAMPILTLDAHHTARNVETHSCMPLFAQVLQKRSLEGTFILAPDEGAQQYAQSFGEFLDLPCFYAQKQRDGGECTVTLSDSFEHFTHGIIVDDMIATGATLLATLPKLRKIQKLTVVVSHVLPSAQQNIERILNQVDGLITSNTFPITAHPKICVVSVVERLIELMQ